MALLTTGFLREVRTLYPGGNDLSPSEREDLLPISVDLRCKCNESGGVVGAVAGSDFVVIDYEAFFDGDFPFIKLPAASANIRGLGLVMWNEGTVPLNGLCWVRVVGRHPYAKVDGTTDVATGDVLTTHASTAGAIEKAASNSIAGGVAIAMAARTTNSIGALAVHLFDRMGILAGGV